jgi:Tol biopolymer transport system component
MFLAIVVLVPLRLFSQVPDAPSLFMPHVVSTAHSERDMAISPDGSEMFCTLQGNRFTFSLILRYTKEKNDTWGAPEVAPFSGKYADLEPAFSPDGKKLFFSSKRPLSGTEPKDYDLWVVEKTNGAWGEPVNLGKSINTAANEFYPSVATNGNLYFTAEYDKGVGKEDIFVSRWENGKYSPSVALDTAVNSKLWEFNAYVSPDEQFILFTSYGRKDDKGGGDLYIAQKDGDGNWKPAQNLTLLNSTTLDYCPFVTFDKKTLFYTSGVHHIPAYFDKALTYDSAVKILNTPENGDENIYWVSFPKVLESLKK